jgi:hypothetical protein
MIFTTQAFDYQPFMSLQTKKQVLETTGLKSKVLEDWFFGRTFGLLCKLQSIEFQLISFPFSNSPKLFQDITQGLFLQKRIKKKSI